MAIRAKGTGKMDMTGERRIATSQYAVWAALNDANVLKQCIPGCESLEKLSDTEMTAKVTVGIGPVHASFTGRVKLSDLDPPNGYRLSGEGSGGLAGHAKGGATVRLFDDGKGTLMKYEAQADVGGKLAQLGSRLIDSAAKKLTDEFLRNSPPSLDRCPRRWAPRPAFPEPRPPQREHRPTRGGGGPSPRSWSWWSRCSISSGIKAGRGKDFVGFTRCGPFGSKRDSCPVSDMLIPSRRCDDADLKRDGIRKGHYDARTSYDGRTSHDGSDHCVASSGAKRFVRGA
jgi:carbon monoxide dehydrogenase subunit G